ncbi:uncharacterized protein EDB91DRAFT_1080768 [Suillus paluster]|uniref:uncharacterized protein n=1 Tax=Suillus paluster TaxID=48578 RepID=UPI001B864E73|nr:uncharacterized protein EDB91DRAFT_1080768 [Suillus paluster]KAG1744680.1 hypothetical protein EDB91DRAFT_1080768 [Suillus paluster]
MQSIRFTSHPKLVSSSTNVVVRQMSLPSSFSNGFRLAGPPYSTCWSECCAYKRFIQLTDDSDEVLKLHGKSYSDFKLSGQEWSKLELMRDILQEPANAQQSFLATCQPTVWCTIPILEFLQETWENMAQALKFNGVANAILLGLKNICKWYHKTDDTDMYFVCLTLDPNYKLAYTKDKWDTQYFEDGMAHLENLCAQQIRRGISSINGVEPKRKAISDFVRELQILIKKISTSKKKFRVDQLQ